MPLDETGTLLKEVEEHCADGFRHVACGAAGVCGAGHALKRHRQRNVFSAALLCAERAAQTLACVHDTDVCPEERATLRTTRTTLSGQITTIRVLAQRGMRKDRLVAAMLPQGLPDDAPYAAHLAHSVSLNRIGRRRDALRLLQALLLRIRGERARSAHLATVAAAAGLPIPPPDTQLARYEVMAQHNLGTILQTHNTASAQQHFAAALETASHIGDASMVEALRTAAATCGASRTATQRRAKVAHVVDEACSYFDVSGAGSGAGGPFAPAPPLRPAPPATKQLLAFRRASSRMATAHKRAPVPCQA